MITGTRASGVKQTTPYRALSIAGSDSGGGAGIQADLKTFAAHGIYGLSAVTAITAQNTLGIRALFELPSDLIIAQIAAVAEDIGVNATKTGMLSSVAIVEVVAAAIRTHTLFPLVIDTVMLAKDGTTLLRSEAVEAMIEHLFPMASIVTPNIPEAEVLWGKPIHDLKAAREAAEAIYALGPSCVVIKGGHLPGPPHDLIYNGHDFVEVAGERIETRSTHGTGCTFSAAITANLASGLDSLSAICRAKAYTAAALRTAQPMGHGHGPLNHFPHGV